LTVRARSSASTSLAPASRASKAALTTLRGDLDDVQAAGQIGLDEADVQPEDLGSLLAQFVAQSIG
jgi:hypothetical protein